jgi:hypothetical protein
MFHMKTRLSMFQTAHLLLVLGLVPFMAFFSVLADDNSNNPSTIKVLSADNPPGSEVDGKENTADESDSVSDQTPRSAAAGEADDQAADPPAVGKQIAQRAEARWTALANRQFEAAYGFESPGYRQLVDKAAFERSFGRAAKWLGAEVKDVKVDAEGKRANVVLMVGYETGLPSNERYHGRRRMDETWINVDDQWWFSRH